MSYFSPYHTWPIGMDIREGSSFLVGPETYYPVGLTISEVFRWLYQVRQWQITLTTGTMSAAAAYTFSLNPAHDASAGVSGTLEAVTFCSSSALTESDMEYMQTFSGDDGTGHESDSEHNDGPPADAVISASISLQLFSGVPQMYVYDGKYWPAIRPSGQISALGSIGLLRIRSEGYRLEPGVGVTGTIDGKSIEFGWDHYESTDYSFPISGDETATASADAAPDGASFAIEPILFWAHEFGDIGPIYDTSTGEELQDRNKIIRRNGEYVRLP